MVAGTQQLEPLKIERSEVKLPHSFFRFPGKIHPPLVNRIIKANPDAQIWMDSMAGCGTVALETIAAGKDGVFGDLDPVSCLVTRVKTNPIPGRDVMDRFQSVMDSTRFSSKEDATEQSASEVLEQAKAAGYGYPDNAFHWFEPHVAEGIASFLVAIHDERSELTPHEVDILNAVVAASTRRLSRADPTPVSCLGVTKVRKKQLENGLKFDVARTLRHKAQYLANGYDVLLNLPGGIGTATVLQGDARDWRSTCESAGIVGDAAITSPPYCHAIEYWRRHRLEFSWLNLVDTTKIGNYNRDFIGVTRRNGTDIEQDLPADVEALAVKVRQAGTERAETLLRQYFLDVGTWIEQSCGALKDGGKFFVVAGANTVQGVPIDTPSVIESMATSLGFESNRQENYLYENQVMQYPTSHGHRVGGESVVLITA